MRLKSIEIHNMHKVESATYHFNSDVSYLTGLNGAGKSTVLQAIQLAILGYIPGYPKTNEGIMRHGSGPLMSVKAVFDAFDLGGKDVSIERTWMRSKGSVSSEIVVNPSDFDISQYISEIELPIFNFSEFTGMTANKLKEWFIGFLPNAGDSIEWEQILKESLESRLPLMSDELYSSVLNKIDELNATKSGVDMIKALNEHLNSELTFCKAQFKAKEETLNSLIYRLDSIRRNSPCIPDHNRTGDSITFAESLYPSSINVPFF